MFAVSYAVAFAAMLGTAPYLFLRVRLIIIATTMLTGLLLLIYGPATLPNKSLSLTPLSKI
jgi:hypothetical protein